MRILVDTNILFSAILFADSRVARVLFYINEEHETFITDQNISELREIVRRKIPEKMNSLDAFLAKLTYEIIPAIHEDNARIRDKKDQPILNAAILNDIDIILTGDKDFLSLSLKRPECLSVAMFCEREGIIDI